MQGTSLLEIETAAGGWRAVTVLDRAVQTDFFAEDVPLASPRAYGGRLRLRDLAERAALLEPVVQLAALFRRQLPDTSPRTASSLARCSLVSACTMPSRAALNFA